MTLVTWANFWKSKVRSGVTYMFKAMDARLHTATCTRLRKFQLVKAEQMMHNTVKNNTCMPERPEGNQTSVR